MTEFKEKKTLEIEIWALRLLKKFAILQENNQIIRDNGER